MFRKEQELFKACIEMEAEVNLCKLIIPTYYIILIVCIQVRVLETAIIAMHYY